MFVRAIPALVTPMDPGVRILGIGEVDAEFAEVLADISTESFQQSSASAIGRDGAPRTAKSLMVERNASPNARSNCCFS
jgi:hypothetical protein